MKRSNDDTMMEKGVAQILGVIPYPSIDKLDACTHEDDGHIYGESVTKRVFHCILCGEFYEELI